MLSILQTTTLLCNQLSNVHLTQQLTYKAPDTPQMLTCWVIMQVGNFRDVGDIYQKDSVACEMCCRQTLNSNKAITIKILYEEEYSS